MEVSSGPPRVPPGQLRSGMIFCAKSPTLGDKLLSNFPRGRGGAMGGGSFYAHVLVLFIKNGRLPLQLTFPGFHFETEAKVDFPSACI